MPQHVCPSSMAPKFQDRLRTQDPDVLESLKVSGALCDVILVVAGQEFKAHSHPSSKLTVFQSHVCNRI